MLLTGKAYNEGARAFSYWLALQLDIEEHASDEAQRQDAADLVALLTPIAKAFMTDNGYTVTNLSQQVFGGHGYIRETGMEQFVRDARISMIYEGTNGIQALDLIGRKIMMDSNVCRLRYIWNNTEESTWDSLLVEAMTQVMVAALTYPITKSTTKQATEEEIVKRVLKEARTVDGQEVTPETLGDFPLLANRMA